MKIQQGYKFQLRPKAEQESLMRRFAGCCRFVWNRALAEEKASLDAEKKRLGFKVLSAKLPVWKKEEATAWLSEVPAQILQQTLRDQDKAFSRFFRKTANFPRFKKKGRKNSFRFPQGCILDEANSRIRLPKLGWLRYRKSRAVEGKVKNITVIQDCGKWYMSVQTERDVPDPVHPSASAVGIDVGVRQFAVLSNGTKFFSPRPYRALKKKLAMLQRRLRKKIRFSANWRKLQDRIQRLHRKIANIRKDWSHKVSSAVCKNHATVVMEELSVRAMTRSGKGTVEHPGTLVRVKATFNSSILDQGWYMFRQMIEYKMRWLGGTLILVPEAGTSQTCSACGFMAAGNRPGLSARFHCQSCGHTEDADLNAAKNILAAGQAVPACGAGKAHAPAMKQEPACGAA